MSILITILIVLAALIAIFLIAALFVKKEYSIERQITINKPKQQVFDYIKYLKNQENYSKWVRTDPNMKKHFRGTDGEVGFVYGWNGNGQAGEGEQEIKNITDGERVDVEIRFVRPFKGLATAPMSTEAFSENQTKVTWGMAGKSAYPMNIMNLFMGGVLGKDLDTSLQTLKEILEKQ